MDATKSQTMRKFTGINNIDPKTRLAPVIIDYEYVYPLRVAKNVEIDNTYRISSRPGYTKTKTGSNIHSMWSDGEACFYVDGATLYQLNTDYTAIALRSNLTLNARMSYAVNNDRYYFTNEYQIGYAKNGAAYGLMDPSRQFKLPLPAGQCIEYFMGCLFVAVNKILYISDPLSDYYDTRTGYKPFAERITMVRAVDDGLYVSDDRIWFIKGKGNDDFDRIEVYPQRAIPNTDVSVAGKYVNAGLAG